ncbi:HAD-IIIA family hydrolase [Puteibacter caeruleilacunae]|nr:HAD-IIIA family hydrolase [Puteibacter caeruleilacunae]
MAFFKEELMNVKAFVFDVDGVLSKDVSPLDAEGNPVRTANVKDGFAIVNAVKSGYPIAIITGGNTPSVINRYKKLGVPYVYGGIKDKLPCLEEFMAKEGVKAEEILYMGDDLPDFRVMKFVGLPTCPADAVTEIKEISKYISDKDGGEGCVRDVIEQVLRAHEKWMNIEALHRAAY